MGARRRACRAAAVLAATVLSVAPAVGAVTASAQGAPANGGLLDEIVLRDELIAAQETLLNNYRCRFGIDVSQVRSGCANGLAAEGSTVPGVFDGVPTLEDVRARDGLIAAQESLLNTYRCRFEFGTDIVPGGCPAQGDQGPSLPSDLDTLVMPGDVGDGVPGGLVTPSGVPVAVLGVSDGRFVVRTPCGNTATVGAGRPIEDVRVVIDPGHGGPYDSGAHGPNRLVERDLNLTLANAVLRELASRDISASTTRTGHYGTLLRVRAAFADALGADALVSIHHNAPTWPTGDTPGAEVYVQSSSDQQARPDSARLGGLLYEEITTALAGFNNIEWSRLSNAGVLRVLAPGGGDTYGMIKFPAVPAVLVEYGYLSNPSEADLFATDDYIATAAKATANAIQAWLNTDRPGTGFVEEPRVFNPGGAPSRCNEVPLE